MIRGTASVLAALLALPALAQQAPPAGPPAKVGLGVGFSTVSATPTVRLPIVAALPNRSGFVRIEPYLSLNFQDRDTSLTQKVSDDTAELGVGLVYAVPVFPYAYAFGGGRVGLLRRAITRETTTGPTTTTLEDSGTGVVIAATFGGDVFLHPRISLGAEGGLGYQTTPKLEDGTPNTLLAGKSSTVFTSAEVVLRFWFK